MGDVGVFVAEISVDEDSGEGGVSVSVRDRDKLATPLEPPPPTIESMENPILGRWAAGSSVEVGANGIIID